MRTEGHKPSVDEGNWWSEASWAAVALELDARAKLYSLLGTGMGRDSSEGLVVFEELSRRTRSRRAPTKAGEWYWVFEPLVYKLLAPSRSGERPYTAGHALWVCLGHFAGDRDNPDRAWLYYLGPEFSVLPDAGPVSDPAVSSRLARVFRTLSFNAKHSDAAARTLLLISQWQSIEPRAEPSFDWAYGSPVIVTLDGSHLADDVQSDASIRPYLVLCDWTDIRSVVASTSRHSLLNAGAPLETVAQCFNWRDHEPPETYGVDFVQLTASGPGVVQSYVEALEGIPDVLLSTRHFDSEHPYVYERFRGRQDLQRRLIQYAGWITDTAEGIGQIIQIDAWLPGEGVYGRSGSMIVAMGSRRFTTRELSDMVTAFKLGCVSVAVESTTVIAGKGEHHHIPKLVAGTVEELMETQERHRREHPECAEQFELPLSLLLAVDGLYEITKNFRFRPRWMTLERILSTEGITAQCIQILWDQVAHRLGPIRLGSEGKPAPRRFHPTIEIVDDRREVVHLSEIDATLLPTLLADLLTEAWEHSARWGSWGLDPPRSLTVSVHVNDVGVTITNECCPTGPRNAGSGEVRLQRVAGRLSDWTLKGPRPVDRDQGLWIREIRKKH